MRDHETVVGSAGQFVYSKWSTATVGVLLLFLACTDKATQSPFVITGPTVGHWVAAKRPTSNQLASTGSRGVVAGSLWFGWGGQGVQCPPTTYCAIGSVFDPAVDSWKAVAAAGAPSPRSLHTMVLTSGGEAFVWGGLCTSAGACGDGALYDPVADAWRTVSMGGAPSPRYYAFGFASGKEAFVWGGAKLEGGVGVPTGDGFAYDPSAAAWRPMDKNGSPSRRLDAAIAASPAEMFVWGGVDQSGAPVGDGAVYDVTKDSWTAVSSTGAPSARFGTTSILMGDDVFVFGGRGCGKTSGGWAACTDSGFLYNLRDQRWRPVAPGLAPRTGAVAAWTGKYAFVFGGVGQCCEGADCVCTDGGLYDPAADQWFRIASDESPRGDGAAYWIGDSILVVSNGGAVSRYFLTP